EADAATEAVPVHGGDHRNRALVDRGERGEAAAVGADERGVAFRRLHLLDVDARVEAAALGAQDDDAHVRIVPGRGDGRRELVPTGDGERVHRWVVHDDLRYAGVVSRGGDAQSCSRIRVP